MSLWLRWYAFDLCSLSLFLWSYPSSSCQMWHSSWTLRRIEWILLLIYGFVIAFSPVISRKMCIMVIWLHNQRLWCFSKLDNSKMGAQQRCFAMPFWYGFMYHSRASAGWPQMQWKAHIQLIRPGPIGDSCSLPYLYWTVSQTFVELDSNMKMSYII